jgi:hypothetical protein
MLFTRIERGRGDLPQASRQAFLVKDRWNDYGYVTMFQLLIIDDAGTWHELGSVKIGGFGVLEGWTASPDLPLQFRLLDDRFFSLGQDDTYYEKLAGLGPEIRVEVLTALPEACSGADDARRDASGSTTAVEP